MTDGWFGRLTYKIYLLIPGTCLSPYFGASTLQKKPLSDQNRGHLGSRYIHIFSMTEGTKNGGTEPYKAVLGVGFPLHKPYTQLI